MILSRKIVLLAGLCLVGCGPTAQISPVAQVAKPQATWAASDAESEQANSSRSGSAPPVAGANQYTVRKPVSPIPESIPPVLLSEGHAKLCRVNVGDALPAVSLPRFGGEETDLTLLFGSQATVVLYWHADRWMSRTALIDLQRDIVGQFPPDRVGIVGIAVRQAAGEVQALLNQNRISFPQLLDTNGQVFADVGTAALPRLYVVDPGGKIVWFDIEYSEATRRELWQTLRVLTRGI